MRSPRARSTAPLRSFPTTPICSPTTPTCSATIDGGFRDKSIQLIEQRAQGRSHALKALALAGTAAFNRKDYKTAVAYWERMKATVPPTSPLAGSIDASIAEARELGGLKVAAAPAASPARNSGRDPQPQAPAPAGAKIAGTVQLAPRAREQSFAD